MPRKTATKPVSSEPAEAISRHLGARVKQLRVGEPLMFFNEASDPAERSNSVTDPHYAAEIQRLGALLLTHMEKTGDPQTANFKKAFEDWKSKAH